MEKEKVEAVSDTIATEDFTKEADSVGCTEGDYNDCELGDGTIKIKKLGTVQEFVILVVIGGDDRYVYLFYSKGDFFSKAKAPVSCLLQTAIQTLFKNGLIRKYTTNDNAQRYVLSTLMIWMVWEKLLLK